MALGATLISCGSDVDPAAVLHMACCALGHGRSDLIFVVNRTVVATQARAILCLRRKFSRFLQAIHPSASNGTSTVKNNFARLYLVGLLK
jgi:hypothetical protein